MTDFTRRDFSRAALGSLVTFSLLETLYETGALADKVKPNVGAWFSSVNQLGHELKGEKISQANWQAQIERLFVDVDLPSLLELVDFEKLIKSADLPDNGARSLRFNLTQVEGVPKQLAYGKQIFGLKKGRSVVPHGHNNMATAFIILKGNFHGRHWDRVEDQAEHSILKPTIDRKFGPAEFSTVTDLKDNVHWFEALDEPAFIFNIHALNINPGSKKRTGRVYIDPAGEKLEGGLIRAPLINHEQAHKLYG